MKKIITDLNKKVRTRVGAGLASARDHRGITLIALIITIILLLILAGVALNFVIGENGILRHAEFAREKYQNSAEKEANEIAQITNELEKYPVVGGTRNATYCTTPATTISTASITNPCVVIENYRNGTEWYRIWSDGWIEQGGHATSGNTTTGSKITFNRNFSDTNFNINITFTSPISDGSTRTIVCTQKNADGFYTAGSWSNTSSFGFANYKFDWYACGY